MDCYDDVFMLRYMCEEPLLCKANKCGYYQSPKGNTVAKKYSASIGDNRNTGVGEKERKRTWAARGR